MPPSRKRAKKLHIASKNVVVNALVGMPMEIIFEIFEYLNPLDLLQLARTTKALRAILMSRSSLSLWKRVRHAYYQMPDGPEGMSEPHYVSLALERICSGCGASSRRVRTFWNAQLNSCRRKCERTLLAKKSNLEKYDFYEALPSWLIRLPEGSKTDLYSLKQVQIWSQEYALLNGTSADLNSRLEWESQITERHALTQKHISSFNYWKFVRDREENSKRSRLMAASNKALLVKLEELGWGEEIRKMSPHQRSDLYFRLPIDPKIKKLESFPQVWSSNGPAILKVLKAIQTDRIVYEWQILLSSRYRVLQEIYDEYIRGLPADALLIPSIADIALSPPIRSILTDRRTNFVVTRQTFEKINIMQILPSIVSEWKIRLDDELIRMVQAKLSEPFTKDQLPLATTVFYCDACDMDLFYPQVLVHHCSLPYKLHPFQCPVWNTSGSIKYNRDVHQAAIDIINILGLDPKVVTAEDMGTRNSVLQCLNCRTTRLGRMTMIWSRAIEHSRKVHRNRLPSMISWKVPGHDEQLTLQASLARELAKSDYLNSVRPRFMCGVCRLKETRFGLNYHLKTEHGIENPGEQDILLHPDAIHAPMPCVFPETD